MAKQEQSWIKYNDRSLEVTIKKPPAFDEWEAAMAALNTFHESGGFYRGDLYIAGENWYGEDKATSIFDPEIWSIKTFQNNASVCQRISPDRRREGPYATYSHHAEVCYVAPEWFDV